MKLVWKNNAKGGGGKKRPRSQPLAPNPDLPFETGEEVAGGEHEKKNPNGSETLTADSGDLKQLVESFQSQGNQLAERGRYREALGKWEAALNLMPENAILHEQKAQVLLEIGDAWSALKAAKRAIELEPTWPEAWVTLGRAQLNFGEPDSSIESFDKALAMKPDCEEAWVDRETAGHLIKKRKQLQSSGLSVAHGRYTVGGTAEKS